MAETIHTQCCIAGGGPAGMMAGWLLARAGIDVVVLEKHGDFLRDFRGDTIHPSTLELMHELGVLDELLAVPHTRTEKLSLDLMGERVAGPDFTRLPVHCKFIAFMPQWDFLQFVERQARRYPGFHLRMNTEAVDLVERDGRITGVVTNQGTIEADVVLGCDGRHSRIRERAQLPLEALTVPIDVLWMRVPRRASDGEQLFGVIRNDQFLVMLDRGDYWQCAYLIRKGGLDELKRAGLPAFRARLREAAPVLADRVDTLQSWDDLKLLSVTVDRLTKWWKPGLLCIGDAAHAMSPVGGVGINLAIQDAVAAANALALPLRKGRVPDHVLASVQRRRWLPTAAIQRLQITLHDRMLGPVLEGRGAPPVRVIRYLFGRIPAVRRLLARAVGMGLRPEHVRTPAVTMPPLTPAAREDRPHPAP
jgi:2-polyprenyl-6-methoxyphenol hydroxylase-like FAD-dependent oxidoreductase